MNKFFYIKNNINNIKKQFAVAAYSLDGDFLGFIYYSNSLKLWDYTLFDIDAQFSPSPSFDAVYNYFLEELKLHGFKLISNEKFNKISCMF